METWLGTSSQWCSGTPISYIAFLTMTYLNLTVPRTQMHKCMRAPMDERAILHRTFDRVSWINMVSTILFRLSTEQGMFTRENII